MTSEWQERSQLLQEGSVVASCFLFPLRSHCGRVAVARNLLFVGDVAVLEGHEQDDYAVRIEICGGWTTLGSVAAGGTGVVWPASDIGSVGTQ